jgi:hypothetical protein
VGYARLGKSGGRNQEQNEFDRGGTFAFVGARPRKSGREYGGASTSPLAPWMGITFHGGAPQCVIKCYTTVNTVQVHRNKFMAGLNGVIGWALPPLVVLAAIAIYAVRRNPSGLYFFLGGSVLIFLYVFALTFHPVFPYYLLPSYVLLRCAARNLATVAATLVGSGIITFVAQGNLELAISIFVLMTNIGLLEVGEENRVSSRDTGQKRPVSFGLPSQRQAGIRGD